MSEYKHEGWNVAQRMDDFHAMHKGEKYSVYMKHVKLVERVWSAYGEWHLYHDTEHDKYYKEYVDRGD